MDQSLVATGGCQCGNIRYRIAGPVNNIHLCHCRMCQKAVGNAFATIGVVQKSDLELIRALPAWFRSSKQVQRGFCPSCGTPLFYADDLSDSLGLMVGTLDQPGNFPPVRQDGLEARLPWVVDLDQLPKSGVTGEGSSAQWANEIARSTRQHPDFET